MLKQLLIFVLCCSWVTLLAQEPLRFTTKQGLPTNHVYDMAEDSNGFMWFATKQGVVKYDGETFKTFTTQNGLPSNDIWKLTSDQFGRVWYFSKSKDQGYIKNDSVYKFPNSENAVITPSTYYKVRNKLWLYTGLGLFTLKNSKFINEYNRGKLFQKPKVLDSIYPGFFKGSYWLPFDNINISLIHNQLVVVDGLQNNTTKISLPFTDYISYGYTILNDSTFFASFKEGFVLLDLNTHLYKLFYFKDLIGQDSIEQIRFKTLTDHFQFSGPGYLLIFDFDWNLTNKYLFETSELSVWSYLDSHGNIWQNSLKNGITLIPNTQLQSDYYLQNEKVQKIGQFNDQLFVGIQNKGFYEFNALQKQFLKRIDLPSYGNIYQIKNDKEAKTAYLVSHNNSYELIEQEIKPVFSPDSLNNLEFGSVFKDVIKFNSNYYFIRSGMLGAYNKQTLDNFIFKADGFINLIVFKNEVYASGSDGLWFFQNDSLVKPNINDELLDVSVNYLIAQEDKLWVGTDGRGLYIYDEKNIHHLKLTDGLSIQGILKEADTLWLATQKGVKKILLNSKDLSQSQIIDTYYESDGLLQNNTNDIYKDGNNLYAATDIGLAKLNLNNPIYKQQPNIYFKTQNDTLSFKNGERDNIAIDFALHDYVNQEHVNYQYRLLPTQKQWTSTKTKTLNFNNLDPKMHTLEVMATDQHGNTNITKQYLEIVPAWWETLLAKISFTMLGLFGLYLVFAYSKNRVRKKEQAKAQQEKRVAGLELQALRSQMNPHFVHNSLNAIQYFIQRNEVELSENYLSKFSQLIRLFFEYSRRQNITIEEELVLLKNYLEIEQLRFEEKLHYKIEVDESIDQEEQLIPSMLLQPIVENAVNHGVFHKPNGGSVNIQFIYIDNSTYKVLVVDDGIGINKSKNIFKASSKNYQSNSSKVLHERLDLLNKSKEWKIAYKIEDRSEINTKLTGTLVSLTFIKLH